MAKKATVELQVLLKAAGIKATTEQVEKLRKELKDVATQSAKTGKQMQDTAKKTEAAQKKVGEVYRNQRGVAQATGRDNKDFARMAQGLGGLVSAYAAVAANVYALSSAFLVLRRAADLSSMIKSAEDFSNRFGRSVTDITKKMQEASGGALTFAEALPTINKAISAGLGTEKIEQLTIAATKAAQTFGGTTNEALSRFISAAQRGRVEIIQTLGIVINTEKAYENYAASIGKTKDALTSFDKSQAIVNATIAESQNVFDGVNIDPNPFQQMLTTMVDLKDTISTFITDSLTPMINFFNKSKEAALILLLAITKMIGSSVFPKMIESMRTSQKELQKMQMESKAISREASERRIQHRLKEAVTVRNITKKQLKEDLITFEKYYKTSLIRRASFHDALITEDGKYQAQVAANRKRDIAQELAYRQKFPGRRGKGTEQISTKELENYRNRLIVLIQTLDGVTNAQSKVNMAMSASTGAYARATVAADDMATSAVAAATKSKVAWQTNFLTGMLITEGKIKDALDNVGKRYKVLARTIKFQNVSIGASFIALKGLMAAAAGVLVGGLATVMPWLFTLGIAISGAKFLWEKFGDAITGTTPEMHAAREALENFDEKLEENRNRIIDYNKQIKGETIDNMRELRAALDFVSGSFTDLNEKIQETLAAQTAPLIGGDLDATKNKIEKLQQANEGLFKSQQGGEQLALDIQTYRTNTKEINILKDAIENLKNIDLTEVEKNFEELYVITKELGITFTNISGVAAEAIRNLAKEEGFNLTAGQIATLSSTLASNDLVKFTKDFTAAAIEAGVDSSKAFLLAQQAVGNFSGGVGSMAGTVNAATKSLVQLNSDTFNYFENLKRSLITTAGGSKEYSNALFEIRNSTQDLIDSGQKGNKVLSEVFSGEDLAQIKQLLGFAADETVTVAQANAKAASILDNQLKIAKDQVNIEQGKKLLALQVAETQERIVRSDKDRINQSRQLGSLKTAELILSKAALQNTLALKKAELQEKDVGGADELAIQRLNDEIEAIERQIGLEDQRIKNQQELNLITDAKTQFLVDEANLTSKITVLNAELDTIKNRIILTGAERLKQLTDENAKEEQIVRKEIQKLRLKRDSLVKTEANTDEYNRQYNELTKIIEKEQQRLALTEFRNAAEERNLQIQLSQEPLQQARALYDIESQRLNLAKQFASSWQESLKIEQASLKIKMAQVRLTETELNNKIYQLENSVVPLTEEEERQLELARQRLGLIETQNTVYEKQLQILNDSAPLRADLRRLEVQKSINDSRLKLNEINKENSRNSIEYVQLLEKENQLNKNNIILQKQQKNAEIELIKVTEQDTELRNLKVAAAKAELEILEAQTIELERQAYLLELKRLEQKGELTIFSKQGLREMAKIFVDETNRRFKDLRSTFEILAVGFVDTLEEGLESAIDILLEGGKDFGEKLREALKASLREVFGEALKARLKESMAVIISAFGKKEEKTEEKSPNKIFETAISEIKVEPYTREQAQADARAHLELEKQVQSLQLVQGKLNSQDTANAIIIDSLPIISNKLDTIHSTLQAMLACCQAQQSDATLTPLPQPTTNILGIPQTTIPTTPGISETLGTPGLSKEDISQGLQKALKPGIQIANPKLPPLDPNSKVGEIGEVGQSPGIAENLSGLGGLITAVTADNKAGIISALFTIAAQLIASQQASSAGGTLGLIGLAAAGGVAPGGFRPLADGGVVKKPTFGLVGEGSRNEAVVPLPNNREIPVQLYGSSGDTINIEQNFDFRNAGADTITQLRSEARMIEERTFNRVFGEINKGGKYAKLVGRR